MSKYDNPYQIPFKEPQVNQGIEPKAEDKKEEVKGGKNSDI